MKFSDVLARTTALVGASLLGSAALAADAPARGESRVPAEERRAVPAIPRDEGAVHDRTSCRALHRRHARGDVHRQRGVVLHERRRLEAMARRRCGHDETMALVVIGPAPVFHRIERIDRAVEEVLYPAMEDFELDIIIGKGPSARSIRLDLPPFTLLGATTRIGLLTAPLRDRFGIVERLEFYLPHELKQIITRAASILGTSIDPYSAEEIAKRSRGTPRIANRLLKRIRDWAQIKSDGTVSIDMVQEALNGLGVDDLGLDDMDRKYLKTLIEKFGGGPVGVETIAASISEDSDSIEDVIEPFMLQLGFLERTPRGRMATPLAYQHLGLPLPTREPSQTQAKLF